MADERTVLAAEDDGIVRALIAATLRRGGFRILEATSGTEALALARQERPDLVLLDVGLPGMDGYATCRALKSDPATAGVPIIMLTARAQRADQQLGIEAGAEGYITKPFSPRALLGAIRQALGIVEW